jgi:hypothetical protein
MIPQTAHYGFAARRGAPVGSPEGSSRGERDGYSGHAIGGAGRSVSFGYAFLSLVVSLLLGTEIFDLDELGP